MQDTEVLNTQFILISRFNWPHPIWETRGEQAYLDWIQDRLRLFSELTVPSVRNSYDKPDRWLLLIDSRTVDIRRELLDLTRGLPVDLVEYKSNKVEKSIQIALSDLEYPARIMTCRLDTDDLIGAGMIRGYRAAEISDQEASEGIVLSFPGGSTFDRKNNKFYFSSYPENPFLCYVEDCDSENELQTVYMAMHVDMITKSSHAKMLRGFGPQWASVVHEDNVANQGLMSVANFSFSEADKLTKYFGIPAKK